MIPSKVPALDFFSSTENEMYGAQFIADFYRPLSGRAVLEVGTRWGIFSNDVDVSFSSATRDINYSDSVASTNLDLRAGLAYHVADSMIWRVGYQAMFLGDVALAPDQSTGFGFFDTSAPARLANLSLHGIYFGGSLSY